MEANSMDELTTYHASFRIGDERLNPLEISNMLGLIPDKSHNKGDPNTSISKKGKVIHYSPFSSGLWSVESKEDKHLNLIHHLRGLLRVLSPLKDKLAELHSRGYRIDMFCGIFIHDGACPGFDIEADILLLLGELNIDLGICIYT